MEKNKGVFIAESMASTKLVSLLRNVKISKNMQNGEVVALGDLVAGEQDLYKQADAVAGETVYLVDAVELDAEESQAASGLDNFSLKSGDVARVRRPLSGDRFSVSQSVLAEAVAVGDELEASGKSLAKAVEGGQFKVVELWNFGTRAIPMARIEVL